MSDRPINAPAPSSPDDVRTKVLLAMLHSARERGDREGARRLWLQILLAELPRVRGIVAAQRDSSLPDSRVPREDVDDVVQEVFVRLHDKIDNLRGKSVGELRNFMRAAAVFAFKDYVRRHVRDDQHRHGSFDERSVDGGSTSTERELARLAERLAADDDEALIAREILHPALALIDEDKRMVLVMDSRGVPIAEIMEALGITRDAVYQRRKRGHDQLREAILELAGEDDV